MSTWIAIISAKRKYFIKIRTAFSCQMRGKLNSCVTTLTIITFGIAVLSSFKNENEGRCKHVECRLVHRGMAQQNSRHLSINRDCRNQEQAFYWYLAFTFSNSSRLIDWLGWFLGNEEPSIVSLAATNQSNLLCFVQGKLIKNGQLPFKDCKKLDVYRSCQLDTCREYVVASSSDRAAVIALSDLQVTCSVTITFWKKPKQIVILRLLRNGRVWNVLKWEIISILGNLKLLSTFGTLKNQWSSLKNLSGRQLKLRARKGELRELHFKG